MATGDVWGRVWGLPVGIISAIFAIAFAFTALHFKFMIYARWFAVPALFVAIGYMFIYTIIPNWQLAWTHKVAEPQFEVAIMTGISFFIISSIMTGDIVRWTRLNKKGSPLPSLWVTIFAFIVGNGIALSIGAIATAASPELTEWFGLVTVHAGIPLAICALGMNWAAGDGCLYNATMGYANIAPKMRWKWAIAIGGAIGAIAAGTAVLRNVVPFMLAIGTVVPPIGGVIAADYWLVRGKKYGHYDYDMKVQWNWFALIAWAVGFLLAWWQLKGIPKLPNQITGVVAAAVVYWILMRGFGPKTGYLPKK
jgi:cytosine permease